MRCSLITFIAIASVATGALEAMAERRARGVHVVESGDSLWTISRRYDCTVEQLRKANRLATSEIKPGDELRVPRCQDEAKRRKAPGKTAKNQYVVTSGDTLGRIARMHQCTVVEVRTANKLRDNHIEPGDTLRVPKCKPAAAKKHSLSIGKGLVSHTVRAGDTLGKIARQYDSSIDHIRHSNRLRGNLIKPGQLLTVHPGIGGRGAPLIGQSVGRPQSGKLAQATKLGRSRAYYRRRMSRIYGTNYVVHRLRKSIELVARRHPKAHKLAIGDISAAKGGRITEHVSHQSGRDVDLGFYFKRKPPGYPEAFVKATAKNLSFDATWDLLTTLAASKAADAGVLVMYISYDVQGTLYRMAKKRGVPAAVLSRMLQYPRGEDALAGIVRHEPGHDDHIHVRFKCPEADKGCR